jgi:hypothetical protein
MSSEKTAEMFKNKSEEEIMNWMIRYMTPEQIKSCFEGDLPDELPVEKTKKVDVDDLRKFCANKRYVIHKIVGEGDKANVYFWYYLIKKQRWLYSIEPLDNFPQVIGANSAECGEDTNVTDDFKQELIEAYNENLTDPSERFNTNNQGVDQVDAFNRVKDQYVKQGINEDWKDILLTVLDIQRTEPVLTKEKEIINFAPILIESVTSTKVNYYYLINDDDELKFVEGNLSIEKFREDLIEIIGDLNLQIAVPGEAAAATAKTLEEWKIEIRDAANDIYSSDLERIKEIYDKFPLSKDSTFFMKNLFTDNEFGNRFGKKMDLHSVDLSQYLKTKFGRHTSNMFDVKVISNKFGTQTIALVSK